MKGKTVFFIQCFIVYFLSGIFDDSFADSTADKQLADNKNVRKAHIVVQQKQKDWYCTNRPQIKAPVKIPGIISAKPTAITSKYKKLCPDAKYYFPLSHRKYPDNKTKMLWDRKMLKDSFKKAVKQYEKEAKSAISINKKFGHADSYLLWLFGHGQTQLGGTLIGTNAAKNVSEIETEENRLKVLKYKLATTTRNFKKLPGSKQSSIKFIEKYWKDKEIINAQIKKQEKKVNFYKFLRNRKGYEPALYSEIIKYKKKLGRKLTPGDVLYLSLKQRDGKYNEALLLAHNTLRSIARPGEGNFAVTGVKGDLKIYKDIFVTLREGDNAGPWYHLFGTGFYDVQQNIENYVAPSEVGSSMANLAEQIFREVVDRRTPDPEKFCFNVWGAKVSREIFHEHITKKKKKT